MRLVILIAKRMGKTIGPKSLQENIIVEFISKNEDFLKDPKEFVLLIINYVVDSTESGVMKKMFMASRAFYQVGDVVYTLVKIIIQGGFVGMGSAIVINRLCDQFEDPEKIIPQEEAPCEVAKA
jgi:hypothetical protein